MAKLLAANWKENPNSEKAALELFRAVSHGTSGKQPAIIVCPPFIYLEKIADEFKRLRVKKNLALGAQDVFWEEQGPFTSEVGPKMLKSLSMRYVIIGHSERRRWLHETDAMVNKKIKLALKDGLIVILCVGESLAIRRKGENVAKDFIKSQLKKDLAGVLPEKIKKSVVIAYEPIWAIGTGKSDKPVDAARIADFIKKMTKTKVLYGGSVNIKNIRDFVQLREIDGALVGGASLKASEFKKMIKVVAKLP